MPSFVVFLCLRILLGDSSGLTDGVADLDGTGIEDKELDLVSSLMKGEQLLIKSGGLSIGCFATMGGNSMTISSSTI